MKQRIRAACMMIITAAVMFCATGLSAYAYDLYSGDYETDFREISKWKTTGTGITLADDDNYLHLLASDETSGANRFCSIDYHTEVTDVFEFETKVKVNKLSNSLGTKVEYATKRILFAFFAEGVFVQTKQGSVTIPYEVVGQWIKLRAEVRGTVCNLYLDDEFVLEYELQPWVRLDSIIQFWTKNNVTDYAEMEVQYMKFTAHEFCPEITSVENGYVYDYGSDIPVNISITGKTADTVTKVEYYLNDSLIETDENGEYSAVLSSLPAGDYSLYAIAYDSSGKTCRSDTVNFTVNTTIEVNMTRPYQYFRSGFGSSVTLEASASDSLYEISRVEFYENGRLLGFDEAYPYSITTNSLSNGIHKIYAVAYNTNGQRARSQSIASEVFIRGDWQKFQCNENAVYHMGGELNISGGGYACDTFYNPPNSYHYILNGEFSLNGGEFSVNIANGRYSANVVFGTGIVSYNTIDGQRETKIPPIGANTSVELMVDESACDIYLNGKLLASYVMPYSPETKTEFSLSGDGNVSLTREYFTENSGVNEIISENFQNLDKWDTAGSCTILKNGLSMTNASVSRKLDGNIDNYDITFYGNITESSGFSLKSSDGYYPVEIYWKDGAISSLNYPYNTGNASVTEICDSFDYGEHLWKISVSRGLVQIFEDGKFLCSYRVSKSLSSKNITLSADGEVRINYLSVASRSGAYLYEQDFDSISTDECNELFTVRKGSWSVDGGSYKCSSAAAESSAYVYTHAMNINAACDFKIDTLKSNSKVYIVSRWNADDYNIKAGYNNESGKWEIAETCESDTQIVQSSAQSLKPNTVYHVNLKLNGSSAELYVNDNLMVSTGNLKHISFGKIGFEADYTNAYFDNFEYEGESKISEGIFESIAGCRHTLDLLEYDDVLYEISLDSGMVKSTDGGLTWSESLDSGYLDGNILKLKNGYVLSVKNRIASSAADGTYIDQAYVSTDGMQTWKGPFNVQPTYRQRDTMNGKITELSDGRVVYCAGDGDIGESGNVEYTGGLRVYYSDDYGFSWKASETVLDMTTLDGLNVQEGKVVELSDGTLRMLCRTDRGFLYELNSYDRGVTWDTESCHASQMISTLCAWNVERDPQTGWHYIIWTYENTDEKAKIQHPRQRLALAVSYDDMKTFNYLTEVDDWRANVDRFMNAGLDITEDYIFANVARLKGSSNTSWQTMIYRIDKKKLIPGAYFTPPYVSESTSLTEKKAAEKVLSGGMAFKAGSTEYYKNKSFEAVDKINSSVKVLEKNGTVYVPLRLIVDSMSAEIKYDTDNEVRISYMGKEILCTGGSDKIEVNGEKKTLEGPVFLDSDTDNIYVPAKDYFEILGKTVLSRKGILLIVDKEWDDEDLQSVYRFIDYML